MWQIDLPAMAWLYPIFGLEPEKGERTKHAKKDIRKAFAILNEHLKTRTFLVGERISLADIFMSTSLTPLYKLVLDRSFRGEFVDVNRWFLTCVNQPIFLEVQGPVELAKKMAVAQAESSEKQEGAKQGKKKDSKEEKKKEKKGKKQESQKVEDEPIEEPKEVDEREAAYKEWEKNLPKSAFNLEEWKRFYSNNKDTKRVAMPW